MKNLVFLVIVALLTLAAILFLFNPKLIQDVWLWIVGLIGPILAFIQKGIDGIKNLISKEDQTQTEPAPIQKDPRISPNNIQSIESKINLLEEETSLDPYEGITITVLRYFSDQETTLGLLFLDNQFYSYTLEDAYHEKKIKGKTRIPAGIYNVDFYEAETPLTLEYRKERKPWFHYHIKIWDIPNFDNVYIHSGSDHTHTEGCLLMARSIYDDDDKKTIFHSKETYKAFYGAFKAYKNKNTKVRIRLMDEDWIEHLNLKLSE